PKDCKSESPDAENTDFRNFVVLGKSAPYQLEVQVGFWPDDFKQLCRTDRWAKAQAIRLLKVGMKYLLS
ncbi:MAG: hypothetical protein ACRDT8_18620, partial [Micromonosporaceae bacterium]